MSDDAARSLLLPIFIGVFGAVALVMGFDTGSDLEAGERTIIVGTQALNSGAPGSAPLIEVGGQRYACPSTSSAFVAGETEAIYDPADPSNCRVAASVGKRDGTKIGMGAAAIALAIVLGIRRRRQA